MNAASTVVACLTPAGAGAIATLGLQGPDAWQFVAPLLHKQIPPEPGQHVLRRLAANGADEVVLTLDDLDHVQRIHIHCHGGAAVVWWLLELLRQRGAKQIGWEEWLRRIEATRLQAEAAIALARAPTLRTAGILLDQKQGALERALREIADRLGAGDRERAAALLDELVERIPLGLHLTRPWKVVLAGATNVGKSSLLNAILGFRRAITAPEPGTTRDRVTALTALEGWPVELIDTAGVRAAATGLEAAGIDRTRHALNDADLILWLLDPTLGELGDPLGDAPGERLGDPLGERLGERIEPPSALPQEKLLTILNKVDLICANEAATIGSRGWPAVSARTGQGVAELLALVARRLVPDPPPAGAPVPFDESLCATLRQAQTALQMGEADSAGRLVRELSSAYSAAGSGQ